VVSFIICACWFKKSRNNSNEIYQKYFNGSGSPLEINCQQSICVEIHSKIMKNEIDETLFDNALKVTFTNLSDTYSRFVYWGKYVKYLESVKNEKEMIEGK